MGDEGFQSLLAKILEGGITKVVGKAQTMVIKGKMLSGHQRLLNFCRRSLVVREGLARVDKS